MTAVRFTCALAVPGVGLGGGVVWNLVVTSWRGLGDPAFEVEQLKEALATQPVIEQAKGMIMLVRACTSDEAFVVLREISQHANVNVNVKDVAAVIVAAASRAEQPGGLAGLDQQSITVVLDETRRRGLDAVFG
ncbi:ANTAR domain-containing protein [Amycolatopsis sp. CA-128772]|uniref:ANTAR domain-containing protein n=1 Tax=Amycolatopsis sp. CA-128772 TaxID=2073159 RepID=UPI001E5ED5BA|nr:ANTAR domain-containing protein [Amycolatopsis sp. CA-128772]